MNEFVEMIEFVFGATAVKMAEMVAMGEIDLARKFGKWEVSRDFHCVSVSDGQVIVRYSWDSVVPEGMIESQSWTTIEVPSKKCCAVLAHTEPVPAHGTSRGSW